MYEHITGWSQPDASCMREQPDSFHFFWYCPHHVLYVALILAWLALSQIVHFSFALTFFPTLSSSSSTTTTTANRM